MLRAKIIFPGTMLWTVAWCAGNGPVVGWCRCQNVWTSEKIWCSAWRGVLPWRWLCFRQFG